MTREQPRRPVLQVVKGEPTAEQLAALVATLMAGVAAAAAGPCQQPPAAVRSAWGDRTAALRSPLPVDAGAWRASGRRSGSRTRASW